MITLKRLNKLIDNFKNSREYSAFLDMKERVTFLDIFHKTRKETYHSAILAWILRCDEFNILSESAALLLLRLANRNYIHDGFALNGAIDDGLSKQIKRKTLYLNDIFSDTEVATISADKNGRVDIVVECNCNYKPQPRGLRIIIENKIDSTEGEGQCDKYYNYFSELSKNDNFLNVYVYLAPEKPETLSNKYFIPITYQELLDEVLYPISKYVTDYNASAFYLREYINTITSIKTDKIIAMNEEYKSLIYKFYNDNKELINALIDAAFSDDKNKAQDLKDSLSKGTQRYLIEFPNDAEPVKVVGHTALAYAIAQRLAEDNTQQDLLQKYGTINCKGCDQAYIMNTAKTSKKNGKPSKQYTGKAITCKDGNPVYCSNQWIPQKADNLISKVKNEKIIVTKL